MPALKRCYYEVLGIERNGTDEDIKKAFRRLALQLHPDKNLDRNEEAKTEFQVLQQAYEVLSNPQERAWYDEHRHAILRGGLNEDFEDDSIDIMPFCTSSCYKGFGDDDEGFYTVYRKLFEKIAAEEVEVGLEDSDEEIPSFGDSLASYEEDVGPFYAFWESFCTRKNFAWHDEYDTRHAGCRRVSRLMDKENKKLRTEAKKDWNLRVRALVDFVKRKDKRVQTWKADQDLRLREREAVLAKKVTEDKAKRQEERRKLWESAKNGHAGAHEGKEQLKEMEAWMADEFGDANEVESSEEEDCLYCEVCNKSFRTEKTFMNHEKSKKHLRQVQILREQMEEEDEEFENSAQVEIEGEDEDLVLDKVDADIDETTVNGEYLNHKISSRVDPPAPQSPSSLPLQSATTVHISGSGESIPTEEEEEEILLKNFINIKLKESHCLDEDEEDNATLAKSRLDSADDSQSQPTSSKGPNAAEQLKKKRRRAPKGSKQGAPPTEVERDAGGRNPEDVSQPVACTACRKSFETKNDLFKHLKQFPEHAAPKVVKTGNSRPDVDPFATSKGKRGKNRK